MSHCVILATADNASRRRGFVVMSSHEEAKTAITALTRTQIKSVWHTQLEIILNVDQRPHYRRFVGSCPALAWYVFGACSRNPSHVFVFPLGFLDGGDRAMALDSRPQLSLTSSRLSDTAGLTSDCDSSQGPVEADRPTLAPVPVAPHSLVVKNLPTLLFSQAQDLHPLFFPFGDIEKLEIVHVSPLGSMSVVVDYSLATAAQEARDSLNGQFYGDFQLEAQFVGFLGNDGCDFTPNARLVSRPPILERSTTDPYPWPRNHLTAGHDSLKRDLPRTTGYNSGDPRLSEALPLPYIRRSGFLEDVERQHIEPLPRFV